MHQISAGDRGAILLNAVEMVRNERQKDPDLRTLLDTAAGKGGPPEEVEAGKRADAEVLSGRVRHREKLLFLRYVKTPAALYVLTVEFPMDQLDKARPLRDEFFASFHNDK